MNIITKCAVAGTIGFIIGMNPFTANAEPMNSPTAYFNNADDLYKHCMEKDYTMAVVYVGGVVDTIGTLNYAEWIDQYFCIPKSVTQGDMAKAFCRKLHTMEASERKEVPAASVAMLAVAEEWSCEGQKPDWQTEKKF